jgi:copper chaperone CopZ
MITLFREEYRRNSGVYVGCRIRRKSIMEKLTLNVEKMFCEECSLALRRFIGHMEGVESIDVEEGKVAITFDEAMITEEELFRITRDSIEKLGYKLNYDV